MKKLTKSKQELEDKREFLLLQIVGIKKKNRKQILMLKKQNDYLNKISEEIVVSDNKRLEGFASELKQMQG